MKGAAKKMLGGFLALTAVLGSFSVPAAAATPDTAGSWDLFDGRAENYELDFKISSGYDVSSDVICQDGYVNIQKGNEIELGKGKYLWLCPREAVDLPEDTPFTAETTLRMAGEVEEGKKGAEISARLGADAEDTNGKLYPLYLHYGDEKGGWISVKSDGSQIYPLDTTQWHDYGLVVDDASETYDVYVDGEMVIPDAPACTYKGGDLFRVGMDTEARGNMDVQAVRLGSGDLYEGNSEEEKPDGENPGEGKPEGENPEDKEWDILKHSFSPEWDSEGWRASSKVGTVTQQEDSVNILKPEEVALGTEKLYHWVVSPSGMTLPRDGFTLQTTARVAGEVEGAANEIGVRMGKDSNDPNGKLASVFLGYGEEGFVSSSSSGQGIYSMKVDTTQWHTYTMTVFPAGEGYSYDLYVDQTLAYENAPLMTYKGGDLIRFGADNGGRCNLDVKEVRLGSGRILPEGVSPAKLTGVVLDGESQKETEAKEVGVTVTGQYFADGEKVRLTLYNSRHEKVEGTEAEGSFASNKARILLAIPEGLKPGVYQVQAEANGRRLLSDPYEITPDREAPVFPDFTPQGFTIEMEDYKYNPTQEFNFPSIVDTRDHPVKNELGDYRYYLFYAPHDAPAGCCVAVADNLNGPWTEYGKNPIVDKVWEKEDGSGSYYEVSHVSSPYVMWNEVYDCWFMYFHGENNITRYATSDDLLNWTYGGICVTANDFSPTGSGLSEASYARVYEHEVPGLGNKYIMTLMVTGSATGGHRNIYWAYSDDGKVWTPVQESLLDPMMAEEYKGNFSGAYFMEWDGRYYVICHASSGNMYAFEVGESLDMAIPWGIFYDSLGVNGDKDQENDENYPDYGRAGAPCFMQDDDGVWHMFYEGGKRLHANIVHATGSVEGGEVNPPEPEEPDDGNPPEPEEPGSGDPSVPDKPEDTDRPAETVTPIPAEPQKPAAETEAADTGDSRLPAVWAVAVTAAGTGLIFLYKKRKRAV